MKQSITPATILITSEIDLYRLMEAINNCNLGQGDLANPINANTFILNPLHKIKQYYSGETIRMVLQQIPLLLPSPIPLAGIKMVSGTIQNVTKALKETAEKAIELMEKIFVVNPPLLTASNPNIRPVALLPDGSICLKPSDSMTCEIGIRTEPFSECDCENETCLDCLVYISYGILFSVELLEGDIPTTYYFIIDPLLKISSGNRPPTPENVSDTH